MATEVLWWIFAAAIVAFSAGTVFSRSVLHSAIFLIGSLAGVGAMYLFLTVEFLALVQFLIYGGAVTVLILLALMLTRSDARGTPDAVNGPQLPFALLVGGGLMAVLIGVAAGTDWRPGGIPDSPTNIGIETISERLFADFGAPFVIASALLLVALVGAIILARQEEGE
ncbi:MAG TPA: NADH-quinone oxidoreductase subunit J [Tepidiformaceae bacterium]|nr:NADH-quinone oxidoreductase subunit J [Tepidiformaceae bacterium]HNO65994.1 NADH-quinone oxidoreductase subunit J [Tepidiformaceae bacterium]